MKADLTYKVKSEDEAQNKIFTLRKYGYKRISNCYWYERWAKGGKIVEIERDFTL